MSFSKETLENYVKEHIEFEDEYDVLQDRKDGPRTP